MVRSAYTQRPRHCWPDGDPGALVNLQDVRLARSCRCSVLDVEGVAERVIEFDSLPEAEMTQRFRIEVALGNRQQGVAVDHARIGQAFIGPHLNFRADVADGSSDWSTGDGGEHLDGRVACEDANGSPARWRPEVSPDDVAACYHSGV